MDKDFRITGGPQAEVFWAAMCADPDTFTGVGEKESGRLVFVNRAAVQMYGADDDALRGMRWTDLLKGYGEDSLRLPEDAADFPRKEEAVFRAAGGKEFPVSLLLSVFQAEGRDYLLIRMRNLDVQRRAESSLKRERERFEALFNHATMGIIVVDGEGRIQMANRYALREFGYAQDELTGKSVEQLLPERFVTSHMAYRHTYNHHPDIRPMGAGRDLFARRRDDSEFPVEISLSPYHTEEGLFVIAFIIDISVRKEKEAADGAHRKEITRVNAVIRKLNDELEAKVEDRTRQLELTLKELQASRDELRLSLEKEKELNDMKSRFVSMASHEFRTPLSTILSSASLIGKYKLAADQPRRDKHVQRITSAVNNLTGILNEFLSIGRIEDGMLSARFSEFDLPRLLAGVCSEMSDIKKGGQQISCLHEGPALVRLDPELLRNIMINLLSNAIKFSPEDGPITVNSRVTEGSVVISVRDEGLGIPEEDREHLFERFFRARNTVNIQGTGLGLYIVSRYAELMGGAVSVTSAVNAGTEFVLRFREPASASPV